MMSVLAQEIQTGASYGDVAIIGDGSRSLAIASVLSLSGHNVRLVAMDSRVPRECEIRERGARVGQVRGRTKFTHVTADSAQALGNSDTIILSSPVTKYGALAKMLAPGLRDGQLVILANAPLGAALQFKGFVNRFRDGLQINVLEMGKLFDWVKIESGVVVAGGPRDRISACGITRNETRRGLQGSGKFWSGLVPASNLLERGFSEVERLIRPTIRLFRIIGSGSQDFDRLSDVLTPEVLPVLSGIGSEVGEIARAYGLKNFDISRTMVEFCGARSGPLREVMLSVSEMLAEHLRYDAVERQGWRIDIGKEVAESFALLAELARVGRIPVPLIDSVIELSHVTTGYDVRGHGRKLTDLGLFGMDLNEIVEFVNR